MGYPKSDTSLQYLPWATHGMAAILLPRRQQCSGWLWLQGMSRREGINIQKERENEYFSSRCAKEKGETSKALDPCRELHNGNVHS